MADTSAPAQEKTNAFANAFEDAKQPGEPPPEVKRDRWGRYLLPDPESGKTQAWTRVTTFAKTVADMYNIDLYHQRLVVKGMSMRPDLFAEAAGVHIEDKSKLNEIANYAREAAGESGKARLGTAVHTFTEKADLGEKQVVPPPWDKDVEAYTKCLKDNNITVIPEFVEATLIIPKFNVAGTLDRLATVKSDKLPKIADLKTGKSVQYAWMEIACQLYLYSQATHVYDHATQELREMPEVDKSRGIVVHLPVGQATATIYEIDLELGARVAAASEVVRDLRKRKNFATEWAGSTTTIGSEEEDGPLAAPAAASSEKKKKSSAPPSPPASDDNDWDDENDSKATAASADDEWDEPSEPPPAPPASEKERLARSKAAAEKTRTPSKDDVAEQDKEQGAAATGDVEAKAASGEFERWEEMGVDREGARYQIVKVGRQQYLLVDIERGVDEEFKLLRDAKARKKELEAGGTVRPLGATAQEWQDQAASGDGAAKADDDDDWGDDEAAVEEDSNHTEEVERLKSELAKIRPPEEESAGDERSEQVAAPAQTSADDDDFDDESPAAAKKDPTDRQWLAELGSANSREELLQIHADVKAAGVKWTNRMTLMAKSRQAELDARAAASIDDDDDWD